MGKLVTTESLTGTAYTQQPVKAPLLRRFGTALGVTLAVLALVVGAILWPGYDSVDTPPQNIEVWALNTSSSHYGQMNTAIREIEAVADATNLSTILQTGETAVVFTDGNRKFATVDQASPEDLTQEDTAALQPTPERTKSVSLGSNRILYVAADGALSTANLDAPGEALPLMVAAPEEEEEEEDEGTAEPSDTNSEEESSGLKTVPLRASAAAITLEDVVVALVRDSAEEQRVLRVDAYSGQILDEQRLMEPVSEDAQISQVQDKWVILTRPQRLFG